MKKFMSLAVAAALSAALASPALAAGPEGWTPADGARGEAPAPEVVEVPVSKTYGATITLDGEVVDTAGIPGAPAGYVPMRALCEASYGGIVEWYPEDNQALFFLDNKSIIVDFNTMTVQVLFETVEGVTPYLDPAGYTFLPVSFLDSLDTVTVDDNKELDVERYDVKTSASDPTVRLANSIAEACEMPNLMPSSLSDMVSFYEFTEENYESLVSMAPGMNIVSNSVLIAQVAEGKLDAAKEDFASFQQRMIQSFEHYLPGPLEMAKNGQIVVSPDGAHLMLIISENNEKAIELFNAAYPAAE